MARKAKKTVKANKTTARGRKLMDDFDLDVRVKIVSLKVPYFTDDDTASCASTCGDCSTSSCASTCEGGCTETCATCETCGSCTSECNMDATTGACFPELTFYNDVVELEISRLATAVRPGAARKAIGKPIVHREVMRRVVRNPKPR